MNKLISVMGRRGWFDSPKLYVLCVLLGTVLALPGVTTGVFVDDYIHVATLEGLNPDATPFDLFRFTPVDEAALRARLCEGPFPWWTFPQMRTAFFRPLSSATEVLDHALFGREYKWWHVQSIVWYLALIVVCGLLLRRIVPPPIAALALILFTVSETHWFPVVWLANRNALVSTLPALGGLLAYMRWREERWTAGLALGLAGFAAGLAGGETALGVVGYLVAYELFAAPRRAGSRWNPLEKAKFLLPIGCLLIVYFVIYKFLGYGSFGSGSYIDPVREPLVYLANAPERILAMLGGLLLRFPTDLWLLTESIRPVQAGVGLFSLVLIGWLLRRRWRDFDPSLKRALCWTIPGGLVSILPVAATFPSSRLLLLPSLGASVVTAAVLYHWWVRRGTRPRARVHGALCWYLAVINLGVPLLIWPLQSTSFAMFGNLARQAYLDAEIDDAHVADQRLILLVAPDPMTMIYPPLIRLVEGRPKPKSFFGLSLAPYPHRLVRTAANRFELEVIGGAMLGTEFERLFRGATHGFKAGDTVDLCGITVTVLETNGQGPTKVAFEFDRPLEDPSLQFLVWKDKGLRRAVLPPVGESMVLPFQSPLT